MSDSNKTYEGLRDVILRDQLALEGNRVNVVILFMLVTPKYKYLHIVLDSGGSDETE